MDKTEKTIELLRSAVVNIYSEKELIDAIKSGKKLKVKLGADPTAPDLHLGDTIGRDKTRPALSHEAIKHNLQSYFDQVGRILDPSRITIRHNSEWLGK